MIKIEYPYYKYKIDKRGDTEIIFDVVRKLWVNLTPEEWVRQNFLQYMLQVKDYPPSLIAVEKEIYLGELRKRCDIVAYSKSSKPVMIVECKAMEVELNAKVIDQILTYNMSMPVKCLTITNGLHCFSFERLNGTFNMLNEIPSWDDQNVIDATPEG